MLTTCARSAPLRDVDPFEVDDQAEDGLHCPHDEPRDVGAIAPEPPPERRDDDSRHHQNEEEAKHMVLVRLTASSHRARGEQMTEQAECEKESEEAAPHLVGRTVCAAGGRNS